MDTPGHVSERDGQDEDENKCVREEEKRLPSKGYQTQRGKD